MDIRVINKKNEIINVSNKSIKRSGKWLIGIDSRGEVEQIEKFSSEEKAEIELRKICEQLIEWTRNQYNGGLIIFREEEETKDE